ncbi:MAG: crosslink repair DNA glycosylase YcaQ family protein, partial [Propionibacteriaceae bacterium]
LLEHESAESAATVGPTYNNAIIWGNSGLIRRPRDQAWDKRTDNHHRTAATLLPELGPSTPAEGLVALVRDHLRAYGPVTRRDLAFFFGVGLTQVDAAVATLSDEVVQHLGPESSIYLDLADAPVTTDADPGLRLLPEFDGLLLGFHGPNRTRFVDAEGLTKIWAKVNGLFTPVVLHDGRLVATWKTRARGKRTDLEVTMLRSGPRLADDLLTTPVTAVETVLGLQISDVRVLAAG